MLMIMIYLMALAFLALTGWLLFARQRGRPAQAFFMLALLVVALAGLQFGIFLFGWPQNPGVVVALALVVLAGLLLILGLAALAKRMSSGVWIFIGLLALAGLFWPTYRLAGTYPGQPQPFQALLPTIVFFWPALALVAAALVIYAGVKLYPERPKVGAAALVLSALLLGKTLHNLYWLTVWDNTTDSLGIFWVVVPVQAAFIAGAMLAAILPEKAKLAGLGYALLVPAVLVAVSIGAQRVDFRQLTEARAERASQAIERYYAREGRYPGDLGELDSWYGRPLPGPVILYGQYWCYEGGEDYYRLGHVDRDHWYDPLLIRRVYKESGDTSQLGRACAAEIAEILRHVPWAYSD